MQGDLMGDVRYALRRMRRAPGFSLAVIGILALGVGANGTMFSALKTTILARPPFPDADRLVLPELKIVGAGGGVRMSSWSYPKFLDFREGTREAFAEIAGYASRSASWTDPGDARSVLYEFVSPGYFEMLGQVPVLGRFFAAEEGGVDAPPNVVVISYATWRQQFGSDPAVLDRTIVADGSRLRIIGVTAEGFVGLTGAASFWLPFGQARATMGSWTITGRDSHWFHAIARLRPGWTTEQARARVALVGEAVGRNASKLVDEGETLTLELTPLGEAWTNPTVRTSVWLLAGAALLVLAIAIANLAALLLARGRREERETAVRLSLGAGRLRLVRGRVIESLLLALVGGGTGLLLATWGIAGIRRGWPDRFLDGSAGDIRAVDPAVLTMDWTVIGVGLAIAAVAAIVFGGLPALVQSRIDLVPALKRGSGATAADAGRAGRRWLLAGQLALSIILLVGAGLLTGTLVRLHQEQRGFDHHRLLALGYSVAGRPAARSVETARAFHEALRVQAAAIPGVRSAANGSTAPLLGHSIRTGVERVEGREPFPRDDQPPIGVTVASSGYFRTLGIPLLQGRTFSQAEDGHADQIIVINRTAAERLFLGESPVGRQIRMGFSLADTLYPMTIVGVVGDVLYSNPTEGVIAEAYLPLGQWAPVSFTLLVRTARNPAGLIPALREALAMVDPDVPYWRVLTGEQLRGRGVADTRALALLLGLFASVAVVLSAAGIWAVVAQAVTDRRREIGLRVALGAEGGDVERLMVGQAIPPLLVGGLVGLGLAAYGVRFLDTLLFKVGRHDPRVFLGAAGLLTAVAILAAWLPARRASRVAPMEVLTSE